MLHLDGEHIKHFTVVERRPNYKWLCICDCGTYFEAYGWNIISGRTTSCGCARGRKPNFEISGSAMENTFIQIANEYANTRTDWDTSTLKTFDDTILYFSSLANVPITSFDDTAMETIMACFAQPKYSIGYYKKIKYFFNAIFVYSIRKNYIKENPMKYIKNPRKYRIRNDTFWNAEQFEKFIGTFALDAVGTKLRLIYALGMYAGLRMQETVALRVQDVDLAKRQLYIRQAYKYKARCIGDVKVGRSYRDIDICNNLYEYIKDYFDTHIDIISKNELLFGEVPSRSMVEYHLKMHQKDTNNPYITYHRFRHSHVVMLLSDNKGLDIGYIMAVAKHMGDSPKTIIQVYMHSTYSEQDIIDVLNHKKC